MHGDAQLIKDAQWERVQEILIIMSIMFWSWVKKKKKINKYNVEATRSEIRFVSHLV